MVWAWDFAVVRVGEEGSICVRMSRAVFCKMDVISEFAVSAKKTVGRFFDFGVRPAVPRCCGRLGRR